MLNQGVEANLLEAKIFGGASSQQLNHYDIGPKNVHETFNMLHKRGIPVSNYDIGGIQSRKLYFLPHTGEVWVKSC